jgi:excisionase family DNA binding protein
VLTDAITTKVAAELTGYHQKYIRQLAKGGIITAERFGRDWMVSKSAILAYKDKMGQQGGKRGPKTKT